MKTERQRAWRRGRAAERLAILALTLSGYRILARNLKPARGTPVWERSTSSPGAAG